ENFLRQWTQEMNSFAMLAEIARQHHGVGPLGRGAARVIARLNSPNHAARFSAHTSNKRQLFETKKARFQSPGRLPRAAKDILRRKFIECSQHRGTGERVRTPSIRALAVIHRPKQVRSPGCGGDRDAVAQTFAEDHDVRLEAVSLEGEHSASATEVGLNFVQDEDDVMFPAKCLK